jgi:chromosome segregation ATPase
MSEEDSKEHRLKLSRLEDENESLVGQLKRMSNSGSKRSSPGLGSRGGGIDVDDLKLQLDVSEGETSVLRKKVESLLSDNLRLTKDVKDLNQTVGEERKKKSGGPSWRTTNANTSQLDEVQTELKSTRSKLIEREREIERLETQVRTSKGGNRRGNEDLTAKMEVVEKEASVLRERNTQLEAENDKLQNESKQKYGKKPPASTHEKLQMDKFALEEKVRVMENKVKEANRRADEAVSQAATAKQEAETTGRVKREKSNLERELKQVKDSHDVELSKMRRLERELAAEVDKVEKGQREVIQMTRERRTLEDEKNIIQRNMNKAEGNLKRLEEECESMRKKNNSNLQQTQDGIKQFKDQIEALKGEVQEEKRKHKESKRLMDEAAVKEAEKLDARVKDLEDKWAKSKRINQQRKDKIDQLEKELEEATKAAAKPASGASRNRDEGSEMAKKYELLEEEYVIAKAMWTSENESIKADHSSLKRDNETIQKELSTLRTTYNNKNDDWIKEKIEFQRKLRDLEDSIRNSAGEGWEVERERFKQIIEDRDSQITQQKIEGDVARSQSSSLRKDVDDLKLKLLDYETMSKFQKVVSTDSETVSNLESKVDDLRKQLSAEAKDKKTELNMAKMQYDSKVRTKYRVSSNQCLRRGHNSNSL